jgi:hypothetical protein
MVDFGLVEIRSQEEVEIDRSFPTPQPEQIQLGSVTRRCFLLFAAEQRNMRQLRQEFTPRGDRRSAGIRVAGH